MTRPEWDLALMCEQSNLTPETLARLFRGHDGAQLRKTQKLETGVEEDLWVGILAAAKAAGAIKEISDSSKPPEERRWRVFPDKLDSLINSVTLLLEILPEARDRFTSDSKYRIAATIPEKLYELCRFFREFENTALGLRRMIGESIESITILVPFMDVRGLAEIFQPLERALESGVKVLFLTREIREGGKNLEVLSGLISVTKVNGGDLQLFEAVLSDDYPISHAKVFSRDGGKEVYVGSANLTAASLERTIELGVFLKGKETRAINEFLSLVKSQSQQRWP